MITESVFSEFQRLWAAVTACTCADADADGCQHHLACPAMTAARTRHDNLEVEHGMNEHAWAVAVFELRRDGTTGSLSYTPTMAYDGGHLGGFFGSDNYGAAEEGWRAVWARAVEVAARGFPPDGPPDTVAAAAVVLFLLAWDAWGESDAVVEDTHSRALSLMCAAAAAAPSEAEAED